MTDNPTLPDGDVQNAELPPLPPDERKAPVEIRSAAIDNINPTERIVTMIAVPYEQRTVVPYRGELWEESVQYGAFDGIETSTHTYRVNRDHDKRRLVGKIVNYYPERRNGLVVDAYISETPLGDETLQLARDGILGASVGMAVRAGDQLLSRRGQVKCRSIRRAFLDHLALVPDPAYMGAEVIGVRDSAGATEAELPTIHTPRMDEWANDPILQWAAQHVAELDQRAESDSSTEPYGDVTYADPGYKDDKKKRYPLDTEAHARAALSYFSMPKNHAGYSPDQVKTIMGRIRSACKKFGIQVSDN